MGKEDIDNREIKVGCSLD